MINSTGTRLLKEFAARGCYELLAVVSFVHGAQPLSERRNGRRVGVRRPLFDFDERRCPTTHAPVARSLQRLAVDGTSWRIVAHDAERFAAVGSRL